jgi:spermidine/putrescine-binding protein
MSTMPMRMSLAVATTAALLALPAAATAEPSTEFKIIVGGIADPANSDATEDASDCAIPLLPVVYDDEAKPNS